MNREQKIKLLKGIAKGERSISEALPEKIEVWYVHNDIYQNAETDEEITGNEYRERYKTLMKNDKGVRVGMDLEEYMQRNRVTFK
jgi:hypothetical protein